MYRIAIVGFGYIGSVIGAVLAEKGHSVVGIDRSEALIREFSEGRCPIPEPGLEDLANAQAAAGRLTYSTDISKVADADVVLVTVGTPLSEDYDADVTGIRAACLAMAPHIRDGQLVMLKSTVPPGVTRTVAGAILRDGKQVRLAFSPERLAEGQAIRDFSSLPIIVGGIDAESTDAAVKFWRSTLGIEVIGVSSPETAEMVKLANNLWIDLNIALAHDLAKLCDALPYPIDVLEVIRGANSLKKGQHYTNILTPSNGVGGYCLTKDPWFVHALGKRHGVELFTPQASRKINDSMPGYVAQQILSGLSAIGVPADKAKVAIMGLAFKSNSGDLRFTPVAPVLDELRGAGVGALAICDPMVTDHEARHLGVELTRDWRDAMRGASCAAFFAGHDQFQAIGVGDMADLLSPGALVYDGRMYFGQEVISDLAAKGFAYKGVGR